MTSELDLEQLVVRAADGDADAWKELWAAIEPPLVRMIAQPRFLGRLGRHEDDRRNIVVAVMARLRADGFSRLRTYLDAKATNPRLKFFTWLRVVAKRVGIDYLRAHPEYTRRYDPEASRPGEWVDPETLPPASQLVGERPPVTARGTAQKLLRIAAEVLTAEQRTALELWVRSEDFDAIARELKLADAAEATRLVRSALERLRRRVRE